MTKGYGRTLEAELSGREGQTREPESLTMIMHGAGKERDPDFLAEKVQLATTSPDAREFTTSPSRPFLSLSKVLPRDSSMEGLCLSVL